MIRATITLALLSLSTFAFAEPSEKGRPAQPRQPAQPAVPGQFQFDPPAGATTVRVMKSVDGDNISTTINEDDREITITQGEDAIKVSIRDGNADPREFTAKDADALKAEAPEAFELYNKYCVDADHGGGLMILGMPVQGNLAVHPWPMHGGRIEALEVRCDVMPNPAVRAQLGGGVFILKVKPDGRGEKLRLKEFDYVKSVNGEAVNDIEALETAVKNADKLSLEVLREGKPLTLTE